MTRTSTTTPTGASHTTARLQHRHRPQRLRWALLFTGSVLAGLASLPVYAVQPVTNCVKTIINKGTLSLKSDNNFSSCKHE